jgi:non-specific serine/threonine protein kinase
MAAAPLLAELLEAAPRLKLLITSRASLQLYGECEFRVPPLTLPNLSQLPPLERLIDYAAVRLFIERARAVKPDFLVTTENAPAVAEICVRLDGLPLAIELAARIKVLTPQALLARLSRRLQVLTGGARNLPARHQTLREAIAWSHELLASAEQALFARLAVFAGGATLQAIEAVCMVDGEALADPLDSIQALVNNSLIQQELRARAEPRLSMLETIGEYALEQLAARGEEELLRARHAAYYLHVAESAQPKLDSAEQAVWLERLEAEHDNLRAALSWALDGGEAALAVSLGAVPWRFWEMRGHLTEGQRWLAAALERGQGAAAAARAAAYTGAGTMALHQGDYAQATRWHQQALNLYQELGDSKGVAFALHNVGVQSLVQGESAAAVRYFSERLSLSQQQEDPRLSAYVLMNLGNVARYQGDYGQAVADYTESLSVSRALGDPWLACFGLLGLGIVAGEQGNDAQATAVLQEVLSLCREHSYQELIAECLEGLAGCAARQRKGVRAARLFGATEQLREEITSPRAPVDQKHYLELVTKARAGLSAEAFEQAWADGRMLPLEEVMTYAMQSHEMDR